jgi:hypothetical protein
MSSMWSAAALPIGPPCFKGFSRRPLGAFALRFGPATKWHMPLVAMPGQEKVLIGLGLIP